MLGTLGRGPAQQRLEGRRDDRRILVAHEPDRDVRLRLDRDHRLLEGRRATLEAVHVDGRLGPRAQVELRAGSGSAGRDPAAAISAAPGRQAHPALDLLPRRRHDAGEQRLRQPPVPRQHGREHLQQRVHRVERRTAVHPRVEVAEPGANLHVEVAEAPHGDVEARDVALDHAAVEDDRRVGVAPVGLEPVHDRVAPHLLLAVARDAQVDRELARGREQLRRLEEHVQLALVVDDAAAEEPTVALDELERLGLPELERIGRLDVEVPVAEDRRRASPRRRRRGSRRSREAAPPTARPRPRLPRGGRAPPPRPRPPRRRRGGRDRR